MTFQRVLILASHRSDGHSMSRYSENLEKYYGTRAVQFEVMRPSRFLSQHASSVSRKYLSYLEKLLLFPLMVATVTTIHHYDIVHVTDHSNAPWLLFVRRAGRKVVTVHDLIAQNAALGKYAEHRPRLTGRIYQLLIRAGLRRAETLLSVSKTTQLDARQLLPTHRHHLAYNWVDPINLPRPPRTAHAGGPILIVSTAGWRKVRPRAIRIAFRLREEIRGHPDVILVGPQLTVDEVSELHAWGLRGETLIVRQDISESELQDLYASASCLVQASRFEGFGWPIVEANAHGTPAIVADEPILREIGLHAQVIPQDLHADWRAVALATQTPNASVLAMENALRFTFDRCAAQLDEALQLAPQDTTLYARGDRR